MNVYGKCIIIVAYPEQTRAHNAQACWNWFRPGDQDPNRAPTEQSE